MRIASIQSPEALRLRLAAPAQVAPPVPEAEMPPYMESFLAHLRLLIGVPFDYLVPDSRLLPDESIRFFYVDRSWTDRLVDGAVAVGKIGTREQAHHQAHHPAVAQQLDLSERIVRILQRGLQSFADAKAANDQQPAAAEVVTGFLLRSAAVVGWPQMDVRAFTGPDARTQLATLRLERLSPAVLLALFQGVPGMVWCEEPHHGVQFGIASDPTGKLSVFQRQPDGQNKAGTVAVPVRAGNQRVVAVSELRRRLAAQPDPKPAQTGAAGFAIQMLALPWRQRFQGEGGTGVFVAKYGVAASIGQASLQLAVKELVK
jgi:hypothetical protein